MPVTPSIQSAASIGDIQPPKVQVTSSQPSQNAPERVIQPQGGSVPTLGYPSDRPKYFMQFDVHEYNRQSLMSIGDLGSPKASVILPLASYVALSRTRRGRDQIGLS